MSNRSREFTKRFLPAYISWYFSQVYHLGFLLTLKRFIFFVGINLNSRFRYRKGLVISSLAIDIVIPCIDKDADILIHVIASARRHIKHPINKIFVVAPVSSVICEICKDNEVIFIDECTVLPISKKDIDYKVDGLDRSGWLFQQFLKWSGESFTEMSDYLVLDSDTVFIRDQVFEYSNKIVMDCADEYHKPYFEFIKRTFGFEVKFPLSFTSHHILIRKSYIHEMKLFLENKYKCAWYFAIISQIDRSLPSAVSDYDNYGQFIYKYHRSEVCLEYWGNESFSRRDIERLGELKKMFSKVRKSLSFHSYSK